ncbi:MAG: hypothetical protein KatS3mg002_0405 [Candidatus Woesearchaeota archaeon]|nr:MAG: hypothetical protein KatS3mg002_0405 [Candidatus Woesearchaeota archaeon]
MKGPPQDVIENKMGKIRFWIDVKYTLDAIKSFIRTVAGNNIIKELESIEKMEIAVLNEIYNEISFILSQFDIYSDKYKEWSKFRFDKTIKYNDHRNNLLEFIKIWGNNFISWKEEGDNNVSR